MSAASIRSLMSDASSAVADGDYQLARTKAHQALALLAAMPRAAQEGFSQEWSIEGVEKFIEVCEVNLARSQRSDNNNSLFGKQKVRFAETDD